MDNPELFKTYKVKDTPRTHQKPPERVLELGAMNRRNPPKKPVGKLRTIINKYVPGVGRRV